MKVLILILSSRNSNYGSFIETLKNTWVSIEVENVDKFFYFGNHSKNELIGNELFLNIPESHNMMGPRTLEAFEYLFDLDYDYIFRVNAGSYIRQDVMMSFLKDKPRTNFYCGIVGEYMNIKYCSGSGFFISKDIVKKLIENKEKIRLKFDNGLNCVDDTAIGEMVINEGFNINYSAKRLSIIDNRLEYQIGDKNVNFINEDEIYHYRIRSDYDRNSDINKIINLHKKLYK